MIRTDAQGEKTVEWNEDYIQVIADILVGFDMPYGSLAWPQELGWEIRECAVESTRRAIRRAAGID